MLSLPRRGRSAAAALVAVTAASMLSGAPARAATTALPTGFATVMNAASGRCLDAKAAATANGTVKAGSYNQSSSDSTTNGARVAFYGLTVSHSG
ncbi:hypothetical protein ABZ915_24150 [Streptomyces sp. NPDC046915]|uniref:RICIN domain-containing protein n=1 Tax=Streptomyces sp. NPDC046915 TaxID=3155257 RepID=UPI00340B155C